MPKLRHSRGLPIEQINHEDLLDMPDVAGTNSDHDVRYLKLDGTNVPTANYNWTTNLTTIGNIAATIIAGTTSGVFGGTLTIASGSITDTTGAIDFDDENLTTTGTITAANLSDMEDGTAQGQMAFWDAAQSEWVHTETSELIWDDTNKNVGIGTTTPLSKLHVGGTGILTLGKAGVTHGYIETDGNLYINIDANNDYANFLQIASHSRGGAGTPLLRVEDTGNVGIGTTSPSLPLDVKAKSGMSAIGGICVKLTNKTGAVTVAGQLVKADTATNDAVVLSAADELESFGVFLDSGKAIDAEVWVVVSGIADVAMEDNTASTRGNWVRSSTSEAGYSDSTNATPPSPASFVHFAEIGHCIESVAAGGAGTHILARCVLHFN